MPSPTGRTSHTPVKSSRDSSCSAAFAAAKNGALHDLSRLDFTGACEVRPVGLGTEGPLVGAGGLAWRLLGHDVGVR